jgi:hypothetical protein
MLLAGGEAMAIIEQLAADDVLDAADCW